MKATTGLLALGLFTLAGAVTVSCGGSSDDGDSDNTAGTSAAGKGTGGSSTAGSSSSAGTTSKAGSSNGGSSNGGSNNGGNTNTGGRNGQGGFNPGAGGDIGIDECGTGVIDGMPCERMQGGTNACQVDDTTYCTCQGRNNPMWVCQDLGDLGMGGAGGGIFGDLTCPANPMNGDDCTGIGACPGAATCFCGAGTVYCQGQQ